MPHFCCAGATKDEIIANATAADYLAGRSLWQHTFSRNGWRLFMVRDAVSARVEPLAGEDLEHRADERIRQLQQANEGLLSQRALLLETLDQHERQRQLISYEIHDGLAQYITAALLRLETYAGSRWPQPPQTGGTCSDCLLDEAGRGNSAIDPQFEIGLALLRKSLDEARRLIDGLRPPILDEAGLVRAIEYLIGEQPPLSGSIDFVHQVQFDRLPPLWEGNLFRIVQEALSNVAKHSQARSARVELRQQGGTLNLSVVDVGRGFDAESHCSRTQGRSGHGLCGIQQRALLLGGTARVISRPGEGTRIEVEVPLEAGEAGRR